MAPRENGGRINVPGEVNQHVARTNMSGKHVTQILWRNFQFFISNASLQLSGNAVTVVDKVENGDAARGHFHIAQQQWQNGLCDRTTAKKQNSRWSAHSKASFTSQNSVVKVTTRNLYATFPLKISLLSQQK